ncbi:hypothetical protein [Nonomuraea sp. bgisy101]|uniref:hypothetical protein n=1 Tax=Nonomuraea sp. bgisy101 TaxID=3413784 RepID=UPI003D70DC31
MTGLPPNVIKITIRGEDEWDLRASSLAIARRYFGALAELEVVSVDVGSDVHPNFGTVTVRSVTRGDRVGRWREKLREHIAVAAEMWAFERAHLRGEVDERWVLRWMATPQTRVAKLICRWRMSRADVDLAADELGVARLTDDEWAEIHRDDPRPP